MMRKWIQHTLLIAAVLLTAPAALVVAPVAAPADRADTLVAVRAARIIDGTGRAPFAPGVVLLRGERIEAVGSDVRIPAGARVIDLGSATILPGRVRFVMKGGVVHRDER